jgi:hypothetical protein
VSPDKKLLKIDVNHLDVEAESLPQQAFIWGEEVARARKRVKEITQELKVVAAELDADVRNNPGAHGLVKVTDECVKAAIIRAGTHQSTVMKLHEAEYHLEILEAFFWSLKDKKGMIEAMITLHGQMYFSRPNTSQAEERNREAIAREVNGEVEERPARDKKVVVRGTGTMKRKK